MDYYSKYIKYKNKYILEKKRLLMRNNIQIFNKTQLGGFFKKEKFLAFKKKKNDVETILKNQKPILLKNLVTNEYLFKKENIDKQRHAECSKHAMKNMLSHIFPINHKIWDYVYDDINCNWREIFTLDDDIRKIRQLSEKRIYYNSFITSLENIKKLLIDYDYTKNEKFIKEFKRENLSDFLELFGIRNEDYKVKEIKSGKFVIGYEYSVQNNDEKTKKLQASINTINNTLPPKMKLLGLILGDGRHYTAIKALHIDSKTYYYHIDSRIHYNNIKPISIDEVIELIRKSSNVKVHNYAQFAVRAYFIAEDDLPEFKAKSKEIKNKILIQPSVDLNRFLKKNGSIRILTNINESNKAILTPGPIIVNEENRYNAHHVNAIAPNEMLKYVQLFSYEPICKNFIYIRNVATGKLLGRKFGGNDMPMRDSRGRGHDLVIADDYPESDHRGRNLKLSMQAWKVVSVSGGLIKLALKYGVKTYYITTASSGVTYINSGNNTAPKSNQTFDGSQLDSSTYKPNKFTIQDQKGKFMTLINDRFKLIDEKYCTRGAPNQCIFQLSSTGTLTNNRNISKDSVSFTFDDNGKVSIIVGEELQVLDGNSQFIIMPVFNDESVGGSYQISYSNI